MFLPWLGLFEQIHLADIYVHYDDVQLPRGRSLMSRVQVKGPNGVFWLTAPIDRKNSGPLINETNYLQQYSWVEEHRQKLRHSYHRSEYFDQMMELAERIHRFPDANLAAFNENAIELTAAYLGLETAFFKSSGLGIPGASSQRLIDICIEFGATSYITGHGARSYLDHDAFEARGIQVEYMDYKLMQYPQLHGQFTPYVSALDAIANCGVEARNFMQSQTSPWRTFLGRET